MNTKLVAALFVGVSAAAGVTLAGWTHAEETTATTTIGEGKEVTIYRAPGCGCCDAYAEYMKANGFDVTVIDDRDFAERSIEAGVPEQGVGCHLAMIDGYAVSGLVPVEIINRLVEERPEITGITLPGMPRNAPGMAPEKTGTLKVYAFGEEGVSVFSDE